MFWLFFNSYSSFSDQQLCDAMYNRDLLAFEEIYDRYSQKLFQYLLWILIDKQVAKDVLSSMFIKLYEYLQKTQWNNLRWLAYRIAHNEMVNYIKSNRYTERDDSKRDQQEYNWINALDEVDKEFKKDQIIQILNTIDPVMREVVYLYYLEERSYSEIADMMKVNINTVGVRIMRTREKIKHELRL